MLSCSTCIDAFPARRPGLAGLGVARKARGVDRQRRGTKSCTTSSTRRRPEGGRGRLPAPRGELATRNMAGPRAPAGSTWSSSTAAPPGGGNLLPPSNTFFIDSVPPPWKRADMPALERAAIRNPTSKHPIMRNLTGLDEIAFRGAFRFDLHRPACRPDAALAGDRPRDRGAVRPVAPLLDRPGAGLSACQRPRRMDHDLEPQP